jgi:hypothetical protein
VRVVFEALLALSVALGLWFAVELGRPWRAENPTMAWLLAAWAWSTVAVESILLLALFRITVPWWVVVVVLAAQDAVWVWRLIRLRQERQRVERQGEVW